MASGRRDNHDKRAKDGKAVFSRKLEAGCDIGKRNCCSRLGTIDERRAISVQVSSVSYSTKMRCVFRSELFSARACLKVKVVDILTLKLPTKRAVVRAPGPELRADP